MELRNKTILILSPQSWGKMFVSKHHYAVALANRGNKVYFVNPPSEKLSPANISLKKSETYENLWVIDHHLNFPYNIKFHALWIFHFLMRGHIKKILKALPAPVDVVWIFETGSLYPFRYFPSAAIKIYHPVDEHSDKISIDSAKGADIIFSVTREILENYKHLGIPSYFINHGISDHFLQVPLEASQNGRHIHVGFSGNLLRQDIDRETLLAIINNNKDVQFEFWGAYKADDSNFGYTDDVEQRPFIQQLLLMPNVQLHGSVNVEKLAPELSRMDAFLICYDIQKDQSHGTNYHKIMEYLASGKVIISNNVTTYRDRQDLVQMSPERDSNRSLPELFHSVIQRLKEFNSEANILKRVQFAKENTYDKQVERIESLLSSITKFK